MQVAHIPDNLGPNSPGDMVVPSRMRHEQLRRARGNPIRQPVIVFGRGLDLPTHDQEHDIDDGDLLGKTAYVGEGAQDVGKQLGQGVGTDVTIRTDNGGEVGIQWAHQRLDGIAGSSTLLAFGQEVEQDGI